MICGFWGLQVSPNRAYTQTVEASFRISMAALDEKIANEKERTVVKITVDHKIFVLCSLTAGRCEQQPLDIVLTEGEEVTFYVKGENTVHLTGNYLPDDDMDVAGAEDEDEDEEDSEEEFEGDSEDDELSLEQLAGKYGVDVNDLIRELAEQQEGEDSEDDSSDDEGKITELNDDEISDEEEDDDYMIDDGAEDDDEELEVDEESLKEEVKKTLSEAQAPVRSPTVNEKKANKKRKAEETPKETPKKAKEAKTPSKKEPAATPKAQAKKESATPTPSKSAKKAEKPKPVTLPNGLMYEDMTVGQGAPCKKGQRVGMRYIGKLTNGKVFDKNTGGKPFSFKLGSGEVIKGWDIGIAGMKNGGERRLTIPAALAYGKRGAPPDIPGNATLVFDVKVVNIR
ncbi:peptidylprolyl isomerase fpr3 [Dispira parvispora]|uniref:FK506-binding protein n=1 Tax=Dispira parvispora TaxID=1520584 RepID=A0A9W8ARP7_9FUNG|nr:peptidylprolyl isomerase fpr3 [Dispira parvispora]